MCSEVFLHIFNGLLLVSGPRWRERLTASQGAISGLIVIEVWLVIERVSAHVGTVNFFLNSDVAGWVVDALGLCVCVFSCTHAAMGVEHIALACVAFLLLLSKARIPPIFFQLPQVLMLIK